MTTSSLHTHINGVLLIITINNPILHTPPIEHDTRWIHDYITTAKEIIIKFHLYSSMVGFILSMGTLLIFESIDIYHVHGYIEGYENHQKSTSFSPEMMNNRPEMMNNRSNMDVLVGWRDYSSMQLNITLIGGEYEKGKLRHPVNTAYHNGNVYCLL